MPLGSYRLYSSVVTPSIAFRAPSGVSTGLETMPPMTLALALGSFHGELPFQGPIIAPKRRGERRKLGKPFLPPLCPGTHAVSVRACPVERSRAV